MRTLLAVITGFIGGFVIGIALSSLIGTIGMLFFEKPWGIKYLSFYTALIGAAVLSFLDAKSRKLT